MNKARLGLLCAMLLVVSSCAWWGENERTDLYASQKTFAATVRALASMRRAGQIGDDEFQQVLTVANEGEKLLDEWATAVLAKEDATVAARAFRAVMTQLTGYYEKHLRDN